MQRELGKMTQSELAMMAIPVIMNFRCECCGSRDLAHDVELCKQAAYIGFDAWRANEMKAGRWVVEEYSDQDRAEMDGEEFNAPDITDETLCPAMGLY